MAEEHQAAENLLESCGVHGLTFQRGAGPADHNDACIVNGFTHKAAGIIRS